MTTDSKTQLVVLEDDVEFGANLSMTLEEFGFDVSWHTSASAALDHILTNHVDLLIADILIKVDGQYSGEGGVKLIAQLRQIQEIPIPIIAISSMFLAPFGAHAAQETAKTVGADALLAKPFSTPSLIKLIHAHLQKN